jgi:glycosyltransferase involved in cell wall biosynthesis
MRLSVVIPVFNRPGLVTQTLAAVAAQTRPPDAVIVVDDGSTDGTADAAEAALGRHRPDVGSGWCLIRASHRGAAPARQTGFERALAMKSDLVGFLDSDDLWPSDFVARAVAALAAQPAAVGAIADRALHDVGQSTTTTDDTRAFAASPRAWIIRNGAGIGSCCILRASAVEAVGGYPIGHVTAHDVPFFCALSRLGPWAHAHGAPVVMRRNHASATREHDHIFRTLPDAPLRWARIFDDAYHELDACEKAAAPAGLRRVMSDRWIGAARLCAKNADFEEGIRCLHRARGYTPWSMLWLKWYLRLCTAKARSSLTGTTRARSSPS